MSITEYAVYGFCVGAGFIGFVGLTVAICMSVTQHKDDESEADDGS